ncbi:MAG TPA: hypothetical protein PLT49_08175 [Ferruginibacter sp.]|nr:hypothetical protein [Ferruginibacter sp.]
MLIENAIKHNVVSKSHPLHIRVQASEDMRIVVSNNLQLRQSVDDSTRIGLNNIIKRYWLVSGREVVVQKNEASFTVTLPLLNLN